MKYKLYCEHCHSQLLDAIQYVTKIYMDGRDKMVTLSCPACHENFTITEEPRSGKKRYSNRKAG